MAYAKPPLQWISDIGTDKAPALAFIELSSIARGLFLTDLVLKKAPVRVLVSQPISGGKHVLLFTGDVASVQESHQAALEAAEGTLVKQILIPGVHPQLAPYLDSIWSLDPIRATAGESVGIIESSSLAGAILAADQALKSANVSLCRMRLGQGIGGKAYLVVRGRQDEVEVALERASLAMKEIESFCRVDLVARPSEEVLGYF